MTQSMKHFLEVNIFVLREANMFSRMFFGWVTPLMQQGYRRPITEKDVWKLDTWDQTETLRTKFQDCWMEESQKEHPWLLRALNCSLGRRFWFGGIFKGIGIKNIGI